MLSHRLHAVIAEEEPALRAVTEESAATGQGWTRKQELGHLIDSATNNRARFIKAALEGELSGPSYDGDGWVRMGGYDAMSWSEIVALWAALNRALAQVIERIPEDRLSAPCRVGDHEPVEPPLLWLFVRTVAPVEQLQGHLVVCHQANLAWCPRACQARQLAFDSS